LSKFYRDTEIPLKLKSTLTGHIDILQIRNGLIHILDLKPNARKERPYTQLMLYALALSRLTGLRLYDLKALGLTKTITRFPKSSPSSKNIHYQNTTKAGDARNPINVPVIQN
jgi:hypothetical protein